MHYKDIIYKDYKCIKIVRAAKYKGRWYVIVSNYGNFPCAYVSLKFTDDDSFINTKLKTHSEVFMLQDLLFLTKYKENDWMPKEFLKQFFIGWNYGEPEDYIKPIIPGTDDKGKKYTVTEISQDCEDVINQLRERQE